MIVVKVELHSARTGQVQTIAKAIIANDGTGDSERGNYDIKVARKNSAAMPAGELWFGPEQRIARKGRVDNYPRLSYNVWRLVIRALLSAFPEEKAGEGRHGGGGEDGPNRTSSVETSRLRNPRLNKEGTA